MSKDHRLITRKPAINRTEGSSLKALEARQREAMAKQQHKGLIFPLSFLLHGSSDMLADFELARLDEVANFRAELHVILDRLIDANSQAAIAAWFRTIDRHDLKVALESPETIDSIIQQADEQIRDRQRSAEELLPRPALEPGHTHLAAAVRYQKRNIAAGKCQNCPEPLDPNSVRYCTKHLAAERAKSARKRGAKGEPGSQDYLYSEVQESTHGRQPGTLASLAMHREKKTRALLAEQGISPEHAAVSRNAAKEALLRVMPDSKAKAMTQAQLFEAATVPSKQTGIKAINELLAEGKVERIGKGGMREPYRYSRHVGAKT